MKLTVVDFSGYYFSYANDIIPICKCDPNSPIAIASANLIAGEIAHLVGQVHSMQDIVILSYAILVNFLWEPKCLRKLAKAGNVNDNVFIYLVFNISKYMGTLFVYMIYV